MGNMFQRICGISNPQYFTGKALAFNAIVSLSFNNVKSRIYTTDDEFVGDSRFPAYDVIESI